AGRLHRRGQGCQRHLVAGRLGLRPAGHPLLLSHGNAGGAPRARNRRGATPPRQRRGPPRRWPLRHPDTGPHSMNPISRTGLFLAITAPLPPPAAGAQASRTPVPTTAQSSAPSATDLDAVCVTGRYIPAPMLSSAQVLSHISREDIEREGASTAAEALNRVPGLSVSQGKYVFVRGLNERYSQALLDGTPLP